MVLISKKAYYAENTEAVDTMEAEILMVVDAKRAVTFTDLIADVVGFAESVDDNVAWVCPNNVYLWDHMSVCALVAMVRLTADNRIEAVPVQSLPYFLDGDMPDLPLAGSFPETPYKSPRWMPVEFRRPK